MYLRVHLLLVACCVASLARAQAADASWLVGVSKVDVTPVEPVRMEGYGNRNRPSEGVETPLYVRCVALRSAAEAESGVAPAILLSVDSIGLPGKMTRELATEIEKK